MEGKDEIKELFSQKLGSYEAKVNPELWGNIASQIGTAATTTAASTGLSVLSKWLIGIGISTAVVTATVVTINMTSSDSSETKTPLVTENQMVDPAKETTEDNVPLPTSNKETSTNPTVKESEETGTTLERTVDVVNNDRVEEPATNTAQLPVNTENEGLVDQDNSFIPNPTTVKETKEPASSGEPTVNEGQGKEETTPATNANGGEQKQPENNIQEEEDPVIVETNTPVENYKIDRLPNIFSPNGDGDNDQFFIKSSGLNDFNVVILSSNNQVVFSSRDHNFRWDGTDLSGSPVPNGQYIYYLTAKDDSGKLVKKYSSLTVTR